jgi:hypothetical protein
MSIQWRGFSNEEPARIEAPVLIAVGNQDFVRLEHAIETFRRIPNAELAVIPNAGDFALFSGHERVIPVVEPFLAKRAKNYRRPLAYARGSVLSHDRKGVAAQNSNQNMRSMT